MHSSAHWVGYGGALVSGKCQWARATHSTCALVCFVILILIHPLLILILVLLLLILLVLILILLV